MLLFAAACPIPPTVWSVAAHSPSRPEDAGRTTGGSEDHAARVPTFTLTVSSPAFLVSGEQAAPALCRFTVTAEDPLACSMLIMLDDDRAEWVFGLELLRLGRSTASGVGRVRVRPGVRADSVEIELRGEESCAVVVTGRLILDQLLGAVDGLNAGEVFAPAAAAAFDSLLRRAVGGKL